MDAQVGTTTMTSAQTLTANYALCDNALEAVQGAGTDKWLQLYGETQTTLEISYTTGAAETSNYIEFYVEYGSGAPALIDWHKETMEYFDDSANQIVLEEWTYRLDGASAATEYTKRIQLPVCTKGIRIYAKEVGKAANFGTVTIKANTQSAGANSYNRHLQTVSLVAGSEVDITKLGGETLGDHGTAVIDHGIQPLYEAKDFDGSALPNAVSEGQAVRAAATLSGIPFAMIANEDGSAAAAVLARTTGLETPAATDDALVVTDVANVAPTAFRSTAIDETPAVAVKASAGNVYGWNLYNPNSYDVFVKFYNTAQGSTTVGTTAVVETVQVPALGSVVIKEDTPIKSFSTAITIAATKLVADADTTAITSDVFAQIYYK